MDIYEKKSIKPMLIGNEGEPFDSDNYIYELKLDGERCIAYLDPKHGTELRNKRNIKMLSKVPELEHIHKQVKKRCILDGELIVVKDGKPDFFEIQRRSLMSDPFRIHLLSEKTPASFTAFDILYYDDRQVTNLPLSERKKLLQKVFKENARLALSRHIEYHGTKFFELAKQQELEGIVAKQKDSLYKMDTRTKDWIKIKHLIDDDFVVCGYIEKENGFISIILGQYSDCELIYKGHVSLGVSRNSLNMITHHEKKPDPPFDVPAGNEKAIWIKPNLVCTVKHMPRKGTNRMQQPVYKGLRLDKEAKECVVKKPLNL